MATPPRLVGTSALADFYGVHPDTVQKGLQSDSPKYSVGYIGKIGGRHVWDLNQIIEVGADLPCQVCGAPGGYLRLCPEHARLFRHVWSRADRSWLSLMQLIAMCRWIVERWEHVGDIQIDDVWSTTCVTPGCDGEANVGRLGPLCTDCATEVHRHLSRVASM